MRWFATNSCSLNLHLRGVVVAALGFLVAHSSLFAAPITFRFQATVGPLPPGNGDVSLPFTLEEGSVIDGRLTIDPELGAPVGANSFRSVQPYSIDLFFDGFSFGAKQYTATSINDSAIIGFGGDVIPADFINLTCSSSSIDVGCVPEPLLLPGTDPLRFSMTMNFAGNVALLPSPTLPEDIDVWNGFTIERRLVIRFIANGVGDSYFTTVGNFSVVPEPTSLALFLALTGQLFLRRLWR